MSSIAVREGLAPSTMVTGTTWVCVVVGETSVTEDLVAYRVRRVENG